MDNHQLRIFSTFRFPPIIPASICDSIWESLVDWDGTHGYIYSTPQSLNFSRYDIAGRSSERSFPSEALRKRTGDTRLAALTWIKRLSFSRRRRIRPGRGKVAMRESWLAGEPSYPLSVTASKERRAIRGMRARRRDGEKGRLPCRL